MLHKLTGWHALLLLAIILLVFGAAKLPALAKSVGQSVRILKEEVHDTTDTATPSAAVATAPADTVAANHVAVTATDLPAPSAVQRAA
jgi:sec-independent protein translocase protein TatA